MTPNNAAPGVAPQYTAPAGVGAAFPFVRADGGKPMNDMQKAALAYISIGWWVLPLEPRGKRPLSALVPNGVHGATNDPDVARDWWARYPDANLGIALLPSKLAAIDVDPRNGGFETLEMLEAVHGTIASDVHAFTGGGGGHDLYVCERPDGLPGTLGKGVDFKTTGYVVAYPSTHPSGKRYEWEASSDPIDGAIPSVLPEWVRDLARAPVAATDGAVFASRFVSEAQIAELRDALRFIDADEYHAWVNVGLSLRDAGAVGFALWDAWSQQSPAYDAHGMGKKWRSFKGGARNLESIFFDAQQNGWANPLSTTAKDKEDQRLIELARAANAAKVYEAVAQVATDAVAPFPVKRLDELCHWMCRTQGVQNSVAVQMAALSVASVAASRLYVSEFGDGAHLYQVLCAQSAAELMPLQEAVAQIMREAGLRKMLREQRFTSPASFFKTLMRAPATLWLAHEWGTMCQFAKRQSSGLLDHVLNLMVGAYSQQAIALDNPEELGLKAAGGVDDDMPSIERPALSMLAITSDAALPNSFSSGEIGRGAAGQILFHRAASVLVHGETQPEAVPQWLVEHLLAVRKLPAAQGVDLDLASIFNGNAQLRPTQTRVEFAALPSDHYGALDALAQGSRMAAPLARAARVQLRRLALVLAVWDNPAQPVVSREILDWAAAFVRNRLIESLTTLKLVGGTDDGKTSAHQGVLQCISDAGEKGMTSTEVVRSYYRFRSLSAQKREELIAQLIEDGDLVEVPSSNGKGNRLVSSQFVREASHA